MPLRAVNQFFALPAGVPTLVLKENLKRQGLCIYNPNAGIIQLIWGSTASAQGIALPSGSTRVFDYARPVDQLFINCPAGGNCCIEEITESSF